MAKINVGRVIAGGLLAGLVINISETILNVWVVAQPMEDALRARNLPPITNQAIGVFVGLAFVLGIATVWVYAAVRPRFGAGPGTAVLVGLAVWFFAYLYGSIGMVTLGIFPAGVTAVATIWGLAEVLIASVAGAWVYVE